MLFTCGHWRANLQALLRRTGQKETEIASVGKRGTLARAFTFTDGDLLSIAEHNAGIMQIVSITFDCDDGEHAARQSGPCATPPRSTEPASS